MEDSARERLIFALDVSGWEEAEPWVRRLEPYFGMFKIGLELFTAEGPAAVRRLVQRDRVSVFLDLKLHDIPTTVERAARAARQLGVRMLTVHAAAGEKVLEAAVRGAGPDVCVLGVTRLTSAGASADEVVQLARVARAAGCGGIVCAGTEAAPVRAALGEAAAVVCPGTRPPGVDAGDQVRVVTPGEALQAGASHLVIGRVVRGAPDPETVCRVLLEEAAKALSARG